MPEIIFRCRFHILFPNGKTKLYIDNSQLQSDYFAVIDWGNCPRHECNLECQFCCSIISLPVPKTLIKQRPMSKFTMNQRKFSFQSSLFNLLQFEPPKTLRNGHSRASNCSSDTLSADLQKVLATTLPKLDENVHFQDVNFDWKYGTKFSTKRISHCWVSVPKENLPAPRCHARNLFSKEVKNWPCWMVFLPSTVFLFPQKQK